MEYGIDLLRFWDVRVLLSIRGECLLTLNGQEHEHHFLALFHVAMDVLPAEASSVSCERMFSSAADTDVPDRSNLHPALMEVLQVIVLREAGEI